MRPQDPFSLVYSRISLTLFKLLRYPCLSFSVERKGPRGATEEDRGGQSIDHKWRREQSRTHDIQFLQFLGDSIDEKLAVFIYKGVHLSPMAIWIVLCFPNERAFIQFCSPTFIQTVTFLPKTLILILLPTLVLSPSFCHRRIQWFLRCCCSHQ